MTLIVYRDNTLISDCSVCVKIPSKGPFIFEPDVLIEEKHHVNKTNTICYIFDNDVVDHLIKPLCDIISLFELNKLPKDLKKLESKDVFDALFLTKRHVYLIGCKGEFIDIQIMKNLVYVAPRTTFNFYDCIDLTAEEMFDCLKLNDQYNVNNQKAIFNRKSLTLITKRSIA